MGSGPSQTTSGTQQSASSPWQPAQPMLMAMLQSMSGLPLTPSTGQTGAAQNLVTASNNLPTFNPQETGAVGNFLSGGGASSFSPLYQGAYNTFQSNIAPMTSSSWINPYTNPALSTAMGTMNQDITNQIKSEAAAAGRSGSPEADQALARGLSQGEGGLLTNQFNTNVGTNLGANQALYSAGTGTAGSLAGLNQTTLANTLQGLQSAGSLPGLLMANPYAQLGATTAQSQLPWQTLGWASGLIDPIAALGTQQSGTSTSTTTQSQSPLSQIMGGIMGGAGALGALGGSGGLPALLAMSDVRTKEDIKPIGMLFDGGNVYSFRYRHDPTHTIRVGLLAQEVERTRPDAVVEIGGIKHVDYGKATEGARAAA
jgi:hypothetical protein